MKTCRRCGKERKLRKKDGYCNSCATMVRYHSDPEFRQKFLDRAKAQRAIMGDEYNRIHREQYHAPNSTYKASIKRSYEKNKARIMEMMAANNKRYNAAIGEALGIPAKSVPHQRDKFRARIIKERGRVCEDCGDTDVQVHHVKTVRDHPELALTDWNVRVLCRRCHMNADRLRKGQEMVGS